jgi:hypothetical protein
MISIFRVEDSHIGMWLEEWWSLKEATPKKALKRATFKKCPMWTADRGWPSENACLVLGETSCGMKQICL